MMEKAITIKPNYNSLEKIRDFVKQESPYESSIEYDSWNIRTDSNGQMEKCIIVKKSSMHGVKLYLSKENTLQMNYLIPNKMMNAYFGESKKQYKNIIEVITGKVKNVLLSGSQEKAFEEIEKVFNKIQA